MCCISFEQLGTLHVPQWKFCHGHRPSLTGLLCHNTYLYHALCSLAKSGLNMCGCQEVQFGPIFVSLLSQLSSAQLTQSNLFL